MYPHLHDAGLSLAYCDQTIETAMPSEKEASTFGFKTPTSCLLIKRRSHIATGAMIAYVEGLLRGNAYVYKLRLGA